MTQSAAPDGRVVRRVIATDAATALLGQIIERHGPVLIHQSGGCCDGSSPMVYPRGEFRLGGSDVLLGTIGTTPVYIGAAQFAVWKHTQLILDVVEGRGGMFSLDNGTGRRFLVRSRTYGEREIAMLHKADRFRAMQASIDSDADASGWTKRTGSTGASSRPRRTRAASRRPISAFAGSPMAS